MLVFRILGHAICMVTWKHTCNVNGNVHGEVMAYKDLVVLETNASSLPVTVHGLVVGQVSLIKNSKSKQNITWELYCQHCSVR